MTVTTERYLAATKEDSTVGRALAIHYPATNGDGPPACAVCYFWPGSPFPTVAAEAWPCPTVRALMPDATP